MGPGVLCLAAACIVIANRTNAFRIACFKNSAQVVRISPGITSGFTDGKVDGIRRQFWVATKGRQDCCGFLELRRSYLAGANTVASL